MKISRVQKRAVWIMLAVLVFLVSMAACSPIIGRNSSQEVLDGDPLRGRRLLVEYGCHSCHTIPGVREAKATVGPPLNHWSDRHYIAGSLSNTPGNLILWIRDPQAIEPGTAMPTVGVTDQDARDMAAYLFTLKRRGLFDLP